MLSGKNKRNLDKDLNGVNKYLEPIPHVSLDDRTIKVDGSIPRHTFHVFPFFFPFKFSLCNMNSNFDI